MGLIQSARNLGRYQSIVLVISALGLLATTPTSFGVLVIAPTLQHWCVHDAVSNQTEEQQRLSVGQCTRPDLNITSDDEFSISNESAMVNCDRFEYDHSQFDYTATEKYNLVCDRQWLIPFAASVFMMGYFLGSLSSGMLSDRFGRKKILLASAVVGFLVNILSAYAPNVIVFMLARLVLGIIDMSFFTTGLVLVAELVRKDQRIIGKFADSFARRIVDMFVGAFSMIVSDYRALHIAVAGAYLLQVVAVAWFVCESPRWLATRDRKQEAAEVVWRIAKFNGQALERSQHLLHVQDENATKSARISDIVRRPVVRLRTFVLFGIWSAAILCRYAIGFNLGSFSADVRVSLMISGALEAPAVILAAWAANRYGRQVSLFAVMLLSGVCCFCMSPLVGDVHGDVSTALFALAIAGKVLTSTLLFFVFLWTPELYPTALRSTGLGACSTVARVAAIAAPQLGLLSRYWPPLMVVVLGVVAVAGALLVPMLPDTTGAELPQTIEDGERFQADHRYGFRFPVPRDNKDDADSEL